MPVLVVVLLAILLAVTGCTEKVVEPPPAPPAELAVPDSVQQVFAGNCAFAGCHAGTAPAAGQDLSNARTSWLNIVGVASTQRTQFLRIAPGDSANSYLVMKLRNDPRKLGQPMPLGGFPLEGGLVLRIARWAQQGAPGTPVAAAFQPALSTSTKLE